MSHLTDLTEATTEALAPIGVRVTSDPAAVVPPCLLIDFMPKYLRPHPCGIVWEWTSVLIPATTTDHLAALWLAETLPVVLDTMPGQVTAADPVLYTLGEDRPGGVVAYQITFQA